METRKAIEKWFKQGDGKGAQVMIMNVFIFFFQPMKPVHGEPTPAEDGADEGLDCALDNANTD